MAEEYDYIVVGAGLAGASAVDGIRQKDDEGSILMIGREESLPYNRPPLSKKLWTGGKTVDDIFVRDRDFYTDQFVDLLLDTEVKELNASSRLVRDSRANTWKYGKLLLATGGDPRRLDIPGGDLEGVIYYRSLPDYLRLSDAVKPDTAVTIIGGGFIGSELAASLSKVGARVAMIFPESRLVERIFPADVGLAIDDLYRNRGIRLLTGDLPSSIEKTSAGLLTRTKNGETLESAIVVVGAGILPSLDLARQAGLQTGNGIEVSSKLQTSNQNVYAAGDNALFPYKALGESLRVEHWDNALNQGLLAGRNMAGANEDYDYMPYFWSDLFEFGYEAVGELDSRLTVYADWQKEGETGVLYYLKEGRVRGVMTCNIYGKQEEARKIIRGRGVYPSPESLQGAIC